MATDINRVTISGNMTRDPEVRATASGMTVLSFDVAVNGSVKNNQTGEWEDRANFVDCTMFGKRAESISQYLSKGMKVFIDGSLRFSQWEDKNGNKRNKLEVIVDDIVFMGNRNNNQQGGYQQPQQPQQYGGQYQQPQVYQEPQQYAPSQQYAPPQQPQPYQQQGSYQQPTQYAPQPSQPAQQQMPVVDVSTSVYDEDIPF